MQMIVALVLQATISALPEAKIDAIRTGMFERLERDARRQTSGATWTKNRTDMDITNPQAVKISRIERALVWSNGAQMLQRATWRDGKNVQDDIEPLSAFMNPALLAGFDFFLERPDHEPCGTGQTCWRLGFAPRKNSKPRGNLEQQLLESSAGTLFVEQEHFGIVHVDAHITRPYTSWKVDVSSFVLSMTQMEIDRTMVTSTVEFSFTYNPILGSARTMRRYYEYVEIKLPPLPPS